jgi:regulatory protein
MTSTPKTDSSAEPGPASKEAGFLTALEKAKRLCASKECCESEIRTRAEKWGIFSAAETDRIINSLTADKFIDEQRYASAFARDKLRYNKWGKIKIAYHLKMKGLPSSIIAEALQGLDEDEYKEIAMKIIAGLKRQKKGGGIHHEKARIVKSMQAKGFEISLSIELLNRLA